MQGHENMCTHTHTHTYRLKESINFLINFIALKNPTVGNLPPV